MLWEKIGHNKIVNTCRDAVFKMAMVSHNPKVNQIKMGRQRGGGEEYRDSR